jgi:hypothetical protein
VLAFGGEEGARELGKPKIGGGAIAMMRVSRFVYHVVDIPFEFVGKIAGASSVAKASHVKGCSASRHDRRLLAMSES